MDTTHRQKVLDQLLTTRSGEEAHRLIDMLREDPGSDSAGVLMQYALQGPLPHIRTHAASLLADMAMPGDTRATDFFARSLLDPRLAYWSIKGLARVSGVACYPALTELALDLRRPTAERAHAIRVMGLASGQLFISGLPTDPGYWKEAALPLDALRAWAAAGYPDGPGFPPPDVSPRLAHPQTPLDRAAAALEQRLAVERASRQDPVNPRQWLVVASDADLAAISRRWPLPALYAEFLRHFSPLHVGLESEDYPLVLGLFGASNLIQAQSGYSYDPVTQSAIADWPANLVVIAEHGGDPLVLDLGHIRDGDAPVLVAEHGAGTWDFSRVAPTFLAFLQSLGSP